MNAWAPRACLATVIHTGVGVNGVAGQSGLPVLLHAALERNNENDLVVLERTKSWRARTVKDPRFKKNHAKCHRVHVSITINL